MSAAAPTPTPSPTPAPAARFVELVDDFLDSLRAAKRSEHTLSGYRSDLYGIAGRLASPRAARPGAGAGAPRRPQTSTAS